MSADRGRDRKGRFHLDDFVYLLHDDWLGIDPNRHQLWVGRRRVKRLTRILLRGAAPKSGPQKLEKHQTPPPTLEVSKPRDRRGSARCLTIDWGGRKPTDERPKLFRPVPKRTLQPLPRFGGKRAGGRCGYFIRMIMHGQAEKTQLP